MARAINADALKTSCKITGEFMNNFECVSLATLGEIIDKQPTIEPKQEWISVKDRLPERTVPPHDVLVYHDLNCGMFVDRAWYSHDKKQWCSAIGMKLKVTHWMPLPEPPKGES